MQTIISDFHIIGPKAQITMLSDRKDLFEISLKIDSEIKKPELEFELSDQMGKIRLKKVKFKSNENFGKINKKIIIKTKSRKLSELFNQFLNDLEPVAYLKCGAEIKKMTLPKNTIEIIRWQK